jgi:HNH endonuclease/AP2 domain
MRNDYEIRGEVVVIFADRKDGTREEILVSKIDLPKLLAYDVKWYVIQQPYNKKYAVAHPKGGGRTCNKIRLHRFITDCPKGKVVDHINGNGLDNRRENLRICTHVENMNNMHKKNCGKYSDFRGVSFHKPSNLWVSNIQVNNKRIHVGYFKTEEEAIEATKKAREIYKLEVGE